MDIKRLVNSHARAQQQSMDDCWRQQLPPVSAILTEHHHSTGHHYPLPPQGEGNVYSHYQPPQLYQQQPPPPQSYFPYQQAPPPSYQPTADHHHQFITNQPAPRSAVSSTRYAPSAERRSLSDPEDDSEDSAEDNLSGGSHTPLPPYYPTAQHHHQQVSFNTHANGTITPPSSSNSSGGSEPETNEFICDVCNVSYTRAPDLRRHKATVHNDSNSREKVSTTFPCDVCGQILLSSHGYQGHMRRHYDERPFICEAPFCSKAFHDSATLARHRRTHSSEHKFECDFCGRRFKRKDNLNTHRKKHQVGGEAINPNLLRKPVSRVNNAGGGTATVTTSSVESTPSPVEASHAFVDLPPVAAPPSYHQQQMQLSPPLPMSTQPSTTNILDVPVPSYTMPPHQMRPQHSPTNLYAPPPPPQPPMYHHQQLPSYQQTISLQQPQPYQHMYGGGVKAEDPMAGQWRAQTQTQNQGGMGMYAPQTRC